LFIIVVSDTAVVLTAEIYATGKKFRNTDKHTIRRKGILPKFCLLTALLFLERIRGIP
jgi:hypothetical protein